MKDLSGCKFGFIEAIKFDSYSNTGKHPMWFCRCECGAEKVIRGSHLTSGSIISCGCKKKERLLSGIANKSHGKSKTKESSIWQGMRNRCMNKNNQAYSRYGGRGIAVCERWDSFENFLEDMGQCPDGHSIDRIDVNGNCEPLNCRWIPLPDQNLNKRNTVYASLGGEKKPLSEIAVEHGVSKKSLYYFHVTKGLALIDGIAKCHEGKSPCNEKAKIYVEYEGKTFYLAELARYLSIPRWKLHRYYRKQNMTIIDAIEKCKKDTSP